MEPHAAPEAWLAAAAELWAQRALKRAEGLRHPALVGEVKQWRPEQLPLGVSANYYLKRVWAALKADARLAFSVENGGVFMPAAHAGGAGAPLPLGLACMPAALSRPQPEVRRFCRVVRARISEQAVLPLTTIREILRDAAPAGGLALGGEPVSVEVFFQAVLSALKSDARVECLVMPSGGKAFRATGAPPGRQPQQAASLELGGGSRTPRERPLVFAAAQASPLRPLRCELDACAGSGATYAAASGLDAGGEGESDSEQVSGAGGAATDECASAAADDALSAYFFGARDADASAFDHGCGVADLAHSAHFKEAALLGRLTGCVDRDADASGESQVYLNTHEPFCIAAVGVQGAGKSHTLACVLEACLIPFPEQGIIRLAAPMTALVLHYDQSASSVCEATGLLSPAPLLRRLLGAAAPARCVPKERLVVLVSPSYYKQRAAFYGDYCTVQPLLLRWSTLSADHIKRIMRIRDGDNQLYVAALLDLLRRYQRLGGVPRFRDFTAEVAALCSAKGQEGPLAQRLALLESLVAESVLNEPLAARGCDLLRACTPGALVVVDLTDPLLSSDEANGIFQVLAEQYRALPGASCGKVLALDEAHKYMAGDASDGLSAAVVNIARLMRHDGMRLVVSTQSPCALAPELLELVTLAVLHRCHSADWFSYLGKKLPLPDAVWQRLVALEPGHAILFASRHRLAARFSMAALHGSAEAHEHAGAHVFPIAIRPRITADRGASKRNVGAAAKRP